MSKNEAVSALASLVTQWYAQENRSNYRILLQSTLDLETRLQAADSAIHDQETENMVYRRAGLRTPAEMALRDLFGGPAWLVRIMEIGLEADCHVVFVRTQSRDTFVRPDLLSKITVLNANVDPWGWDDENDGSEANSSSLSLKNLSGMLKTIHEHCTHSGGKPAVLVWESLSPLFLVHGFERMLKFLQRIDSGPRSDEQKHIRILQIWTIRSETLTLPQHETLEDYANALLNMKRGEMTLLRQGIRETGNVVRENLPFHLVPQDRGDMETILSFRLQDYKEDGEDDVTKEPSGSKEVEVAGSSDMPEDTKNIGKRRPKIKIELESEDTSSVTQSTKNVKPEGNTAENRPRIFLQDNDPEFDDMDEEDPDDDLDI